MKRGAGPKEGTVSREVPWVQANNRLLHRNLPLFLKSQRGNARKRRKQKPETKPHSVPAGGAGQLVGINMGPKRRQGNYLHCGKSHSKDLPLGDRSKRVAGAIGAVRKSGYRK